MIILWIFHNIHKFYCHMNLKSSVWINYFRDFQFLMNAYFNNINSVIWYNINKSSVSCCYKIPSHMKDCMIKPWDIPDRVYIDKKIVPYFPCICPTYVRSQMCIMRFNRPTLNQCWNYHKVFFKLIWWSVIHRFAGLLLIDQCPWEQWYNHVMLSVVLAFCSSNFGGKP